MDFNLRFHNDGFRIMLVGDPHGEPNDTSEKDKAILKDYLELQYAALEAAKPDLVVLMGDNAGGDTPEDIRKTLFRITKPYVDKKVPFTFILGNHDLQYDFTDLDSVYGIYSDLPGCILPKERSPYGDFTIPVLSENNEKQTLQVICLYSGASVNAGKGSYYDWVLPEQQEWLIKKQNELGNVPSVLFQHIPLPEEYALLNRKTPVSMLFDGVMGQNEYKGNYYTLKRSADGYLGEAPCSPAVNSGEFESIKRCGNIFAVFFGHDHMNDFVGMTDGVILGQCQTASFNVYGDGTRQGVRILDFKESAPYTLETKMLRYRDLISLKSRSLKGSIAVLHDKTSVKIETVAKTAAKAAAAVLPAVLCAAVLKRVKRK